MSDKRYAIMRFEKIKTTGELRGRSVHNRRLGPQPGHIDARRAHLNFHDGNAITSFREKTKGLKIRKNAVVAVEFVLAHSKETGELGEKWVEKNRRWLENEFGKDNLVQFDLHRDEAGEHIHAIIIPLVNGKLNAREIFQGRTRLKMMQNSYAEAMGEFGLKRGDGKKGRKNVPPEQWRAEAVPFIQKERAKITAEAEEKISKIRKEKDQEIYEAGRMRAFMKSKGFSLKDLQKWEKKMKKTSLEGLSEALGGE